MAGLIRRSDIDEVRSRVNIADVVGDFVTLKGAGVGSLKGLCPFHDERSPSFHVRTQVGRYHCFGCGEDGDVFTFLMKMDHTTFSEAVERMAGTIGYELHYEDGGQANSDHGARARILAANKAASDYFVAQLGTPEAEPARLFLGGRGFDPSAAQRFGVGFAPKSYDALSKHLKTLGYTEAELLAAGLVGQGDRGTYDRFRGRLVWPIRDVTGQTLGFGARKLLDDDQGPKYLNTPETAVYHKSQVLYGLDLAKRDISRGRQVVVVEGYTDVMACHLAGITTAVATCGTAFGVDHIKVIRRVLGDVDNADTTGTGEVVFTFDPDEAGQKAASRAFSEEQRFVAQTFVAVAPDGLDPCDLRLTHGDDAVRRLVQSKKPMFEFMIKRVLGEHNLETVEGRVAALRASAPVVAGIRDQALNIGYVRNLAGWLGMDPVEVGRAVTAAKNHGTPSSARSGQGSGSRQVPGSGQSSGRQASGSGQVSGGRPVLGGQQVSGGQQTSGSRQSSGVARPTEFGQGGARPGAAGAGGGAAGQFGSPSQDRAGAASPGGDFRSPGTYRGTGARMDPDSPSDSSAGARAGGGEPANGQPANGRPANGRPANGQPANGQPADGRPANGQLANGRPANGRPATGEPANGQPANGQPTNGQPTNGQPANGRPASDRPANGLSASDRSGSGFASDESSGYEPSGYEPSGYESSGDESPGNGSSTNDPSWRQSSGTSSAAGPSAASSSPTGSSPTGPSSTGPSSTGDPSTGATAASSSTGPSAAGPSTVGHPAVGRPATGRSAAGPSATGPTSTDPISTDPPSTDPSSASRSSASSSFGYPSRDGFANPQGGHPGSGQPGSGQPEVRPDDPEAREQARLEAIRNGPSMMNLPSDPATRLERDAVMAILQHPEAVPAELVQRLTQAAFSNSSLAVVRDGMAGSMDAYDSPAWLDRVVAEVPLPFANLVRELGMAPLPQNGRRELTVYCQGVTANLIDRDLLRRKRDLLGSLQRSDAVADPTGYRALQVELVRIESERRVLRNE